MSPTGQFIPGGMGEIKTPEGDIIGMMKPDTIHIGSAKTKNPYLIAVTDEEKSLELQVSERIKLTVFLQKNSDKVSTIRITKYRDRHGKGNYEEEQVISFSTFTLSKIADFLKLIGQIDLGIVEKKRITLTSNDPDEPIIIDENFKKQLLAAVSTTEGQKKFQELLASEELITGSDIIGLGYRKQQLDIFTRLLSDPTYLSRYRSDNNVRGPQDEAVWQHYFKKNPWIFGYGLNYIFLDTYTPQPNYGGSTVEGIGEQKGDYLTFTKATVSFTSLVEIKKPTTVLVTEEPNRNGCNVLGKEFIDAVSQLQINCQTWQVEGSRTETNMEELHDKDIYTQIPKGILVVGNTGQLNSKPKRDSFQVYRRNLINPEVITYDELYERAKAIVQYIERR